MKMKQKIYENMKQKFMKMKQKFMKMKKKIY